MVSQSHRFVFCVGLRRRRRRTRRGERSWGVGTLQFVSEQPRQVSEAPPMISFLLHHHLTNHFGLHPHAHPRAHTYTHARTHALTHTQAPRTTSRSSKPLCNRVQITTPAGGSWANREKKKKKKKKKKRTVTPTLLLLLLLLLLARKRRRQCLLCLHLLQLPRKGAAAAASRCLT